MAKKYFTLLERDNDSTPWAIAFGAYDRTEVEEEGQTLCEDGYTNSNLKIITTGEAQAEIDAKVEELNAPLVAAASKATTQEDSADLFMRSSEGSVKSAGWFWYIVKGAPHSRAVVAMNGPFDSEEEANSAGKELLDAIQTDTPRPAFIHPSDCNDEE